MKNDVEWLKISPTKIGIKILYQKIRFNFQIRNPKEDIEIWPIEKVIIYIIKLNEANKFSKSS